MDPKSIHGAGPPTTSISPLDFYPEDRAWDLYALVSSLYGPGIMICWYQTTLSVLLSWLLHPHKRASGSIDADLLAVLALPAAAIGHLVVLIRSMPASFTAEPLLSEEEALQGLHAIRAPLAVVQTFEVVSMLLLAVAMRAWSVRRAFLVAGVGLACFAVTCHPIFNGEYTPLVVRNPGEEPAVHAIMYLGSDMPLSIPFFGMLLTVSLGSAALILTLLPQPSAGSLDLPRARRCWNIAATSVPFVLVAVCIAFLSDWWEMLGVGGFSLWRFGEELLPQTTCSLADLEQATAACIGALMLGHGVHSIIHARRSSKQPPC